MNIIRDNCCKRVLNITGDFQILLNIIWLLLEIIRILFEIIIISLDIIAATNDHIFLEIIEYLWKLLNINIDKIDSLLEIMNE